MIVLAGLLVHSTVYFLFGFQHQLHFGYIYVHKAVTYILVITLLYQTQSWEILYREFTLHACFLTVEGNWSTISVHTQTRGEHAKKCWRFFALFDTLII